MRAALLTVALALVVCADASARIVAPAGVGVRTVARGIGHPSNIAWDARGRIWTTSAGYVPSAADGVWHLPRLGARPRQVVRGLFTALGLTWFRGELYVSYVRGPVDRRRGEVAAYSGFDGRRFKRRRVVRRDLPVGRHTLDSIVPGPGGRLYLGIGSRFDDRSAAAPLSATIVSFRANGGDLRIEARGLRNPYGLAFVPGTDDLLVTDNGRDDLGPDRPPEEVNVVSVGGTAPHFGFPRCWGQGGAGCRGIRAPIAALPPHSAPGGVAVTRRFGSLGFSAFVAQNGSTIRPRPTGSDVLRLALTRRGPGDYAARVVPFARGFRAHDPLGAGMGPDGALYVTLLASGRILRFAPPR